MRIEQNILEILERSAVDGAMLRLPPTQLDRSTYAAVNKVIEAAGGRWDRKAKAHVFDGDAVDTIDPILLSGEYSLVKQDFGQFDSPPGVVDRVIELAQIQPGMLVLEPSAGVGNIAMAAERAGGRVTTYEIDEKRSDRLAAEPRFKHTRADFLTVEPNAIFDVVAMNPPFAKQADIKHVMHASKFLMPGGRLVSVMSASVTFRTDARTEAFRDFLNANDGRHEVLPGGAFKESGTMVNAVIVSFNASAR